MSNLAGNSSVIFHIIPLLEVLAVEASLLLLTTKGVMRPLNPRPPGEKFGQECGYCVIHHAGFW